MCIHNEFTKWTGKLFYLQTLLVYPPDRVCIIQGDNNELWINSYLHYSAVYCALHLDFGDTDGYPATNSLVKEKYNEGFL